MIPDHHALVTLNPARQAALQAIVDVENRRAEARRLSELPHARTFLRIPTGSSRLNSRVAHQIPGLCWEAMKGRHSLKQVEDALEILIASRGERCTGPLCDTGVQGALFPDVKHNRADRRAHREKHAFTHYQRQQARRTEQQCLQRQNLLDRAATDLNFQSPETVRDWYSRWGEEFDHNELEPLFWRWKARFSSLSELRWLRTANEPLWRIILEITFIVQDTPEHMHIAERWMIPNKLVYLEAGREERTAEIRVVQGLSGEASH
ncbi:plasmid SOS inhibition protein A [Scandinavium sp. NPDC088450]|uniref:plasmid SOS inhibition protein A n=1 Tax=Scandinavium sp. NPDC088450 TaxID=3364514 RepID=UPI00384D222D